MEFNQIIVTNECELSIEEKRFVSLHKDIVFCGNSAVEYAVKMASDLKEMRDSKAYKVAGFETFGSYTENALGIKERQAYNYISVLEKLPVEFLHSNAKIGISKLVLLSGISESDREEIFQNVNIEDISVKELKAKIKEQDEKIKQLSVSLDEKAEEVDKAIKQVEEANSACEFAKSNLNNAVNSAVENLKKQNVSDIDLLNGKIKELKSKIKELENAPREKEIVKDESEINKLRAELDAKQKELEKANKEVLIASDLTLTKFQIEFDNLQALLAKITELINTMDSDARGRCKKALSIVFGGVINE